MSAREFLDSNVLVYAYDPTDQRKQQIARRLVHQAIAGNIMISTQVIAEFASTQLYKKKPGLAPRDLEEILDTLGPIPVIAPDWGVVRRAVEAHQEYGIHFYDGMIIAAAERAGCTKLWTEDLNSGQTYFGVTVADPFSET